MFVACKLTVSGQHARPVDSELDGEAHARKLVYRPSLIHVGCRCAYYVCSWQFHAHKVLQRVLKKVSALEISKTARLLKRAR